MFLAALLVGGGVGIGWALDNPPDSAPPAITTTAAPAVRTAPTIDPGEEPVAAVAEALLPSMVQIDTQFGLGSGFVYEPGLVLTAAHVVDGDEQVLVRFADGSQTEGTVVGADVSHDIAVIAVDTGDTPPASLALGEALQVGQLAVALGSPWGLEQTVTSGVISAVNRPVVDPERAQVLIQTDASINPGNSGGALANRRGQVVGVNVQIFSMTGANSGVGFAVPIDTAFDIAGRLVAGTPIETAILGVTGEDATGDQTGAVIVEITAGSAADEAGLRIGDLVTAVDSQAVRSIADLAARVRSHAPGDHVELDVIRDGEALTLVATLGS
ncbi:MAG: S1C family serine protease [Actinomycetota bacterium]